jgi:hypothetical protein
MFKPFTQVLSERAGESSLAPIIDADAVARSFGGMVSNPNEPLRDTGDEAPISAANVSPLDPLPESLVREDFSRAKRQKPTSLTRLACERLQKLEAIATTSQQKQRIKEALSNILITPLSAVDSLLEGIEREYFDSLDSHWEDVRVNGRRVIAKLPALRGKVATVMQRVNATEEAKVRARAQVQLCYRERTHLSRFASQEEIETATSNLTNAEEAARNAAAADFEARKALNAAENELALAISGVEQHARELDRLELAFSGKSYFDPATGLSTDPTLYRSAQ